MMKKEKDSQKFLHCKNVGKRFIGYTFCIGYTYHAERTVHLTIVQHFTTKSLYISHRFSALYYRGLLYHHQIVQP